MNQRYFEIWTEAVKLVVSDPNDDCDHIWRYRPMSDRSDGHNSVCKLCGKLHENIAQTVND